MADPLERLRRRAERERIARKQAEAVLEERSRALWASNRELEAIREQLEERVALRTADLRRALERAEEASAARTRFLAQMSHELRTPLSAILGYTSELRRDHPDLPDLEAVERNAVHLAALLDDALDLAKVDAGSITIRPVHTDLPNLMLQLRHTFQPTAAHQGLRFLTSLDAGAPDAVIVDAQRLRQILINLVGNALAFTERGTVALRVFRPDPNESRLRCDVIDTGPGIRESALEWIFQPFRHEPTSTESSGLGLAISRQLATAMGGSLTVVSKLGSGSCFTLEIPAPTVTRRVQRRAQPAERATPLEGLTLLVAEDARDSRMILQRWCERAGATVISVEDGQRALEAMDESVDAVLMDMQMPVLDGYAATEAMRDRGWSQPIIALTALSMQSDRDACEAAGCDGFLSKPVRQEELLAALLQVVDPERPG